MIAGQDNRQPIVLLADRALCRGLRFLALPSCSGKERGVSSITATVVPLCKQVDHCEKKYVHVTSFVGLGQIV